MEKLDIKNKKILHSLDINSRQTNSQIAKRVGLSKQLVGQRLRKIQEVVSSYYTVIDVSKLGFTIHKSFLSLQNLDHEKEKKMITFLKAHPDVVWIASCEGKYDLAFGTWAKDIEYLDKTLKGVSKKFGKHISERQIATIIKGFYFIRDYLVKKNKPSSFRKSFFGAVPNKAKVDMKDWKILHQIANNPRFSIINLAKKVKLSPDSIRNRIKKMESAGIIKHYNFVPNEETYPFLHYKLLLGLRNLVPEDEKRLIEYCRKNQNIVYTVKALGPWEFEIDLEVESTKQFREIMMNIKTEFKDIIKEYSTLHIYKVHKYNFCPSIQA
tara:strand:- start:1958 stop:2932 length:975 start_codon:yes stop_codon:yes gene_type:complete